MKGWLVLGSIVAAVLVLGLALWLGGLLPEALVPWAPAEEPLAVEFRPLAEVEPLAEAEVAATAPEERRAVATEAAAAPEAPEPIGAAESAAILARLVDASGHPLERAFLRHATPEGSRAAAASAQDGRARLELELLAGQKGATIEAGCRGFASRSEEVRLSPGETVDLGTLQLEPGGGVRGHVLDGTGAPLAGAVVTLDTSGANARDLEAWRYVRGTPSRLERVEVPRAVSGAGGEFVLTGLPEGLVRLWAQAFGRIPSYTPPIEVRAGQESYGVQIVLPQLEATRRIAGIVLEPEGEPVPHAELDFEFHTDDLRMTYTSERRADAEGRFEFMLPPDAELAITARDPLERFGPASAEGVRTGGPELVLRLGEGRAVRLLAVGADGELLDAFDFEVLPAASLPDVGDVLSEGSGDGHALQRGSVRPERTQPVFRLPEGDYVLRVVAPLHLAATLGPLSPATTGEEVQVRLEAAPGLAGVVRTDAGPLAGARVALHALVPDDERLERNGFRCWVEPDALEETESDSAGRFLLTVRSPGSFVVRAEGAGLAPAEAGPLELDPRRSPDAIELRLGAGGAIVGRLVPPLGEDATGRLVAVDRGDGRAQRKRVGPDGAYRFEGLMPGAWRVESLEEESLHTITQRSPSVRSFEREVKWSCTVVEGETTRFDLLEGDPDAYVLAGRLDLEQVAPGGLIAWLCPSDLPLVECFDNPDRWPKASLDDAGRFELGSPEPGSRRLVVKHASARAEWVLIDAVRLVGPRTEWDLALPTGTVVIEGLAEMGPGEDIPPFVYWWEDAAGRKYLRLVGPDETGTCTLDHVPEGEGRLVSPSMEAIAQPEQWPVVLSFEVVAGEETRVAAP